MDLSDIGKHCIWADRRLATLLSKVSEEDFIKTPEQTDRSLKDIVAHIMAGYNMVLGGDYVKATETYTQKMNQQELLQEWASLVEKFIVDIESNPEKSYNIKMDDGSSRTIKGQNYLLSYTDHSSYHRGQIVTTFKFITSNEAISTDFYDYLTKTDPLEK